MMEDISYLYSSFGFDIEIMMNIMITCFYRIFLTLKLW